MLKIDIDVSEFEVSDIEQKIYIACQSSIIDLLTVIEQDCLPYVPKRTGRLRDEVRPVIDMNNTPMLEYYADYAQYVYGMDDVRFTTKGTSGHWFEAAEAVNRKKWVQEYAQLVKERINKQ